VTLQGLGPAPTSTGTTTTENVTPSLLDQVATAQANPKKK
jgi:hypothetical protein